MDHRVFKLIELRWGDLTDADIRKRYPYLIPATRYTNYQKLSTYRVLARYQSNNFVRKAGFSCDQYVQRFFSQSREKFSTEYILRRANMSDIAGEFAKYNQAEFFSVSDKYLDVIYQMLVTQFSPFVIGSIVLEWEDLIPLIDFSTSCGAIKGHKYKSKQEEFDAEGFSEAKSLWENPLPSIGTVCPKVTIAKREKVEQGKVRSFLITPLAYNMCVMRYCSHFNLKLNSFAGEHPIFVGYNIWDAGWHRWIMQRKKTGKSWWAIDLTQCDSRVHNQMAFLEFRLRYDSLQPRYQTDEHYERFYKFWSDQTYLHVWFDGLILRKNCGNSSGWSNTIYYNSVYLFSLFAYCWLRWCEDRHVSFIADDFSRAISLMVCGDDAVFHFIESGYQLLLYATELGAIVKLEDTVPRPIEENTFCSNKTVKYRWKTRSLYVPVLDSHKLLATWALGTGKSNLRLTYLRTAQLLQWAVFDDDLFSLMNSFLEWLIINYRQQLTAPGLDQQNFTWEAVRNALKTRTQILEMWMGKY